MKSGLVVAVAVALAGALAGCAEVRTPAGAPSPSAVGGGERTSSFAIDCSQVIPASALYELWGKPIEPRAYLEAGAAGSWEMQATGLIQDGALPCAWSEPGSPNVRLIMLALDSAANGYERSEPSFLGGQVAPYAAADLGDRASVFCRDDSRDAGIQCHWNVLAGQSWVSFFFQNVPRSEVENGVPVKDSGMSTIVRTALEALEESPRRTITRPESSLVPCDETLSPESLGRIFDADPSSLTIISGRPVEDSLGRSTPAFGQVMWAYSYERLGYSECAFGGPNVQGSVMIAPGAAWILTEPDAKHGELVEVAGFGPGVDECRTEGTFTLCTVAVAIGDDLALAQVVPIDPGAGSAQARALITSLLPND